MGYEEKRINYWNDEKIIDELRKVFLQTGKLRLSLLKNDHQDLVSAMAKRKKFQYYRRLALS